MPHEQISITTKDGTCRTSVFTPEGRGPWPAVIYCMDALGLRPSMLKMGERLAKAGYIVLVPDLFYRLGPYETLDPKYVFAQKDILKIIGPFMGATDTRRAAQDAGALLSYLDTRKDFKGKVGTVGYCMGGTIAISIAGTYPDRVAATASFHGGFLATDSELSAHLYAPKIKAKVYLGVADKDNSYPPEMAARFEKALKDAGVDFRSELYPGALHGWTQTDFPIYNEAAAERHWTALLAFYDKTLKNT